MPRSSSLLQLLFRVAPLCLLLGTGSTGAFAGAAEECEQKNGEEAIRACTEVIKGGGDIAWAYYNRGVEYGNLGRYDEAIPDYTAAIRLRPIYSEAFNNRGHAYENKREIDRAIADYSRAIDLNPVFAIALNNRANVYKGKGDLDKALADCTRAIEADPKYAFAYSNRADINVKRGEYERAISDAEQAIALQADLADAYAFRAGAYVGLGDYDRAIADYTRALEIEPDSASIIADLGFARYYKGDFRSAADDLKRAFAMEAGPYLLLFRHLSRARLGEASRDELIADAQHLPDPAAWPQPVIEMFAGRRTPEATMDAARSNEEKCEASYYVGQWYLLADERSRAVEHLTTASRTCPRNFIERRAATAELKALNK